MCVCVSERWRPLNCVTVAPEILLTRSSADGNLATGTGAARSALIPDLFLFRFFRPSVCPPLWLSAFLPFSLSACSVYLLLLVSSSCLFLSMAPLLFLWFLSSLLVHLCLAALLIQTDDSHSEASNVRSDSVQFDIMSILYQSEKNHEIWADPSCDPL